MDWLLLAALGIMWAAFLVPMAVRRRRSMSASVADFERRMEFLAHAEVNGTPGRWIVTPRKGVRFIGDAQRRHARVLERRRRILVFLLQTVAVTALIGLVPPLHAVWNATVAAVVMLGAYVWMLLAMKGRSRPTDREVDRAQPPADRPAAFAARYVIEGMNGRARERFNGLDGLAESDRVHVVVRPVSDFAG